MQFVHPISLAVESPKYHVVLWTALIDMTSNFIITFVVFIYAASRVSREAKTVGSVQGRAGVARSNKVGWTVWVGRGDGCPLASRGRVWDTKAFQYAPQRLNPRKKPRKKVGCRVVVSTP